MQKRDSVKLKEGFINAMQGRILSGELKPGDRLPTERELAEQYGISRGSVNQGILDLERMGLIRIAPRKGTFVADYMKNPNPMTLSAIISFDSELVDDTLFRDLMELRIIVERECLRLACARIGSADLQTLSTLTENIYKNQDDPSAAIYEYHLAIVRMSGNSAYHMVYTGFEKMIRNLVQVHYRSREEMKKSLSNYESLTAAIRRGDLEEAEKLMTRIMDSAKEYMNALLKKEKPQI